MARDRESSARAFRVAYDGRDYHGFQRQPDVPTVSDAILQALRDLDVLGDGADVPPGYAAAGRTDAGVSAVAQTVAFAAPDWLAPAALNAELPADVRAWASADVPATFHATHDAAARSYTYYLHAPAVPVERVRDVTDALGGRQDFHNLSPDEDGTVRDLSTAVERDGEFLVLTVRARGFPRQLVRRLVTLIEAVATGERDFTFVDRVLSAESLAGPDGIGPAPPEPLVLSRVDYPSVEFTVDEAAAASAREIFDRRRTRLAAASRVCGDLAALDS